MFWVPACAGTNGERSCCGGQSAGERDEARDRNVLGALGRCDAGRGEQRLRVIAERFQTLAQHLAALAEGGLGHALQCIGDSQASGSARGTSSTTDEVTFGGGTKALAAMSNRMRASQRQPASTESRP